jgi:hypothetical protein
VLIGCFQISAIFVVTVCLSVFLAANEEMLGFYSSGPKIKENDLKVTYLENG